MEAVLLEECAVFAAKGAEVVLLRLNHRLLAGFELALDDAERVLQVLPHQSAGCVVRPCLRVVLTNDACPCDLCEVVFLRLLCLLLRCFHFHATVLHGFNEGGDGGEVFRACVCDGDRDVHCVLSPTVSGCKG